MTNDKLRSLILTALMVLSVFAGTIAFTGSATAAGNAVVVDSTVEAAGNVEIVTNTTAEAQRIEVYLDGTLVAEDFTGGAGSATTVNSPVTAATYSAAGTGVDTDDATDHDARRHNIDLGTDIYPNRNLTVQIRFENDDPSATTTTVTERVDLTAAVINESDDITNTANAKRIYRGGDIAIRSDVSGTNTDIYLNATKQDLSTGAYSRVLTVDSTTYFTTGEIVEAEFAGGSDVEYFVVEKHPYAGGYGTETGPYRIENWSHLENVRENLGANFALENDLNETTAGYDEVASETANGGKGFDSVGNNSNPFDGALDGHGHTISNLTIDRTGTNYVGLFGAIGFGATVSNVSLVDADVTGKIAGGLVGLNSGTVNRTAVSGTVESSADNSAGGVAGLNDNAVYNTTSSAAVIGGTDVGGLVGAFTDSGIVRNSSATGDVTGDDRVGGLVGDTYQSGGTVIEGSFAAGSVSGNSNVGGLVGRKYEPSATVNNSYWDTAATGQDTSSGSATGLITAEMTGMNATRNMGNLSFYGRWVPTKGGYPELTWQAGTDGTTASTFDSYFAGDGTEANPYVVTTAPELQAMDEDRDANYVLGNDVDAASTSSWNGGKGFDPVGSSTSPFTGSLEGQGNRISNLTIDRPSTDWVGLFGRIGEIGDPGTVSNVSLTGVDVTGGKWRTGGLAGSNSGTLDGVVVSGEVDGRKLVGGVAGENDVEITNATASGTVNGTNLVGGLVGSYTDSGVVRNSSATNAVNGSDKVGGLVGDTYHSGGIVIEGSFAAGSVSGDSNVGGLVGRKYEPSATVNNSYWDLNATGQVTSAGSATGLTTDEMTGAAAETAMANLSFPAAWITTGGYPQHRDHVTGLNLSASESSLTTGETTNATATLSLLGGRTRTATTVADYASSDSAVATADGGTVDAVGAGSATVSATHAGRTDTLTVTVTASGGGGDGGGDGGGGTAGGDTTTIEPARTSDDLTEFDVSASQFNGGEVVLSSSGMASAPDDGAGSGGATAGSGDTTAGNVVVDSLAIRTGGTVDADGRVSVRGWGVDAASLVREGDATTAGDAADGPTSTAGATGDASAPEARTDPRAFLDEAGAVPVGYVEIDHTVPDSSIEDVTFEFRVRKSSLNAMDVGPESVALYRDESDGWNELDATQTGEDATYHYFEATSPGLSLFAVGASRPVYETSEATVSATRVAPGDEVVVEATVENLGGVNGTQTVTLTADGETVDQDDVAVDARSTATTSLSFVPDVPGEYDLAVNGRPVGDGTLSVERAAGYENGGSTGSSGSAVSAGRTDSGPSTGRNDGVPDVALAVGLLAALAVGLVAVRVRRRRPEDESKSSEE